MKMNNQKSNSSEKIIDPTISTFRHYLVFWGGQLFSLLGSSIVQFVVIWWITDITGSAVLLSITAFFAFIPIIIIGPVAGVYIDRWNRKMIIAATDAIQALLTFFLIIVFLFGFVEIWIIIFLNSLRGICQAIHFPAVNAIIPIMVPKKYLSRLNGINYLFQGLINSMGPVFGAFFFELWGIEAALSIDIITFGIALFLLLSIKIPKITKKTVKSSFKMDFKMGIRVLKMVPGLLILLILISSVNFLSVPFNTLMPLFIKRIHNGNSYDLAYIMALIQVGLVLGSIRASIKKVWRRKVHTIFAGILIAVIGYFMATLAPIGLFFLIGIGGAIRASMIPIINTNFLTIIQTNVTQEAQGRVMSIVLTIASAISPLGMILSGPLSEIFGIVTLYFICATLIIVSVIIVYISTNVRKVRYDSEF